MPWIWVAPWVIRVEPAHPLVQHASGHTGAHDGQLQDAMTVGRQPGGLDVDDREPADAAAGTGMAAGVSG
jgi:hypothetical protein